MIKKSFFSVVFERFRAASSTQAVSLAIVATLGVTMWGPSAHSQTDDYTSAYIGYHLNNFEYSEKIWTKLAQEGDMNSQYALGVMQLRGESKNSSPENAYKWFSMAADQGHSTAMFNVGVALWEGSGVKQDRNHALSWWQKSAEKGDSGAQFNLGLAYYLGEERDRDIEEAAKWISLAEQQNHPEANRVLQAIMDENPVIAARLKDRPQPNANQGQSQDQNTAAIAAPKEPEASTSTEASTQANTQATTDNTATSAGNSYWKTASGVQLKSDPKRSAPSFTELPEDTPVDVIQTRGEWAKVTLPDGLKTWIFNKFLSVQGSTGSITGTNVRVRPRASTDNNTSPPLGVYKNGDKVTVLNRYENWTQIRAPKYVGGWVPLSALEKYRDSQEGRKDLWSKRVSEGL